MRMTVEKPGRNITLLHINNRVIALRLYTADLRNDTVFNADVCGAVAYAADDINDMGMRKYCGHSLFLWSYRMAFRKG